MANGGDASYCFDASVFQPHVSLQHGTKQGAGTAAGHPSAAAPFDAPAFVQSMMVTHGVPLAELRADLSRFVTSVKTELVRIINRDYADFVRLSSTLEGFDASIHALAPPLARVQRGAATAQAAVTEALNKAQRTMQAHAGAASRTTLLRRFIRAHDLLGGVQSLLEQYDHAHGTHGGATAAGGSGADTRAAARTPGTVRARRGGRTPGTVRARTPQRAAKGTAAEANHEDGVTINGDGDGGDDGGGDDDGAWDTDSCGSTDSEAGAVAEAAVADTGVAEYGGSSDDTTRRRTLQQLRRLEQACVILERASHTSLALHRLLSAGGSVQASFPFFKRLRPQLQALDKRLVRQLNAELDRVIRMLPEPRFAAHASRVGVCAGHCIRGLGFARRASDVEKLVCSRLVVPYLVDKFMAGAMHGRVRNSYRNLGSLLQSLLGFVDTKLGQLVASTAPSSQDAEAEVVASPSRGHHGVDLPVNAVWGALLDHLTSQFPSMWAPSSGTTFLRVYRDMAAFMHQFADTVATLEAGSGANTASVLRRMRCHASMQAWERRVHAALPVVFQLCLDDALGAVESACKATHRTKAPPTTATSSWDERLQYEASGAVWEALKRCWSPEVCVPPLTAHALRTTLQATQRYLVWANGCVGDDATASGPGAGAGSGSGSGAGSGAGSGTGAEGDASSPWQGASVDAILCLCSDLSLLAARVDSELCPAAVAVAVDGVPGSGDILKPAFVDHVATPMRGLIKPARRAAVAACVSQCEAALAGVRSVPSAYRMTNRPMPTAPSSYVPSLLRPLRTALDKHARALGGSSSRAYQAFVTEVVARLADKLDAIVKELLTTEEKMDASLQWLSTSNGSSTVSDADKIRCQFRLDAVGLQDEAQAMLGDAVGETNATRWPALAQLLQRCATSSSSSSK